MSSKKGCDVLRTRIIFVIVVITFFLGWSYGEYSTRKAYSERVQEIEQKAQELEEELLDRQELIDEIKELRKQNAELNYRMMDWLDEWQVEEKEITGYAPLDSRAKESVCYEGDPNITASGQPVIIGQTAAAGPSIPFGTKVWVEGIGFRVVQDRGGRIGNGHIDVAVETQEEAFRGVGREKKLVVMQRY